MLSAEDNNLLCRVGPGTPMGNLMRQYWIPAVRSDELPSPDCPPLRVKLLGEELIAFRMTSGKVGLIQNACPHRGASLFYGRNEEEGLRCVYHGWKFDATGACVDMPSEPPESNFKSKVRATAYPCVERGGIVWAYMGPREVPPPLPDLEPNMLPEGRYSLATVLRECNWLQALEGDIDTSHLGFLHHGLVDPASRPPGSFDFYVVKDRAPRYDVIDTEFGTSYGAYRPAEEDTYYWRIAHFLFPFYTMVRTAVLGKVIVARAWVPIDDDNMMFWQMAAPETLQGGARPASTSSPLGPRGGDFGGMEFLEPASGWLGRFRIRQNRENDYLIDREAQRRRSFTGIAGIHQQDQAITESMGPIYDRSREHLGTSDSMIIRTRRRLLNAAKALRDHGVAPPGVDNPEVYRQRAGSIILPRGIDWWQATRELRKAFVDWPQEVPPPLLDTR